MQCDTQQVLKIVAKMWILLKAFTLNKAQAFIFKKCVYHSVVSDSANPWTIAVQAPLSMGFSRQEYWSGLPFPSPGDFLDPRIEPRSTCIAGRFFTIWATGEAQDNQFLLSEPPKRLVFLIEPK